jgi:signal transduction histidine kinase
MAIRAEVDKDALLQRLVTSVQEIVQAPIVQILLLDEHPVTSLAGQADQHGSTHFTSRLSTADLGALHTAVESRSALWVSDWHGASEADQALRLGLDHGSLGLIPIIASRDVYAVVEIAWDEPHDVALSDRAVVAALAEQTGVALERIMIRDELAERAVGAEALHQVSARLAGRRDMRLIAEDALTALRTLYRADAAVYYLSTPDGEAEAFLAQGLSAESFSRLHREYAGGQRGWLLRSGRSLLISNVGQDRRLQTRELLAAEGVASLIDVPAVWEERTTGGLVLYHRGPRRYASYEIQLLETFAEQLAGGMALAEAYRAIETFDHQREEFLALMSHELRQPVAGIAATAEALAGTPGLGPTEAAALEAMRQQARSLAMLAEDVLSIAQLESGQLTLRPTGFDLGALVGGICAQSADAARITTGLPQEPVIVEGDPERLGQALQNLIGNALKYSDPGAQVSVRARATGDLAVIEVQDHGVGIDPNDISRLFEKYARVPNRRSDVVKGAGLGLYLTRLLVEAHGGTVSAASPGKDQGATFTVTVPLGQQDEHPSFRVTSPKRGAARVQ